jgi:hypothetical protein
MTDATCALPMAKPLAPAPIFKNSLEYFLNCAVTERQKIVVNRVRYNLVGFIRTIFDKRLNKTWFHKVGLLCKISL